MNNQLQLQESIKKILISDYEPPQNNQIKILQSHNMKWSNRSQIKQTEIAISKYFLDNMYISLKQSQFITLGSGTGVIGIFLGALGANVLISDFENLEKLINKNISLNKQIIKGKLQFMQLNWNNSIETIISAIKSYSNCIMLTIDIFKQREDIVNILQIIKRSIQQQIVKKAYICYKNIQPQLDKQFYSILFDLKLYVQKLQNLPQQYSDQRYNFFVVNM